DKVLLWIERQRITQAPSEAKAPLVIEGSDQDDRVLPQFGERARRPLADDDSLAAGLQRAEHPSHRHGIGERNRRCRGLLYYRDCILVAACTLRRRTLGHIACREQDRARSI